MFCFDENIWSGMKETTLKDGIIRQIKIKMSTHEVGCYHVRSLDKTKIK